MTAAGRMTMRLIAPLLVALAGPGNAADTADGQALFQRYCATCHGDSAMGDGPTAQVVTVIPPDLTTLSQENGGAFPLERVVRRIDGSDVVIAHGSPMPIYGAFFEGGTMVRIVDGDEGISASQPVVEIVEYLRSLQR